MEEKMHGRASARRDDGRRRREKRLLRGGCVIHFDFFTAARPVRQEDRHCRASLRDTVQALRLTTHISLRESREIRAYPPYSLFRHRIIRRGAACGILVAEISDAQ